MKKLLFITLLLSSLQPAHTQGAACPEPGAGAAAAANYRWQDMLAAIREADLKKVEVILKANPELGRFLEGDRLNHFNKEQQEQIADLKDRYYYPKISAGYVPTQSPYGPRLD